jgi:DNA invertase Pin-like site-specific DNA recombinase
MNSRPCLTGGISTNWERKGIDTTTRAGKALFGMMGVFAEFERSMIQERVRAGLERARREGKRLGCPLRWPQVAGANPGGADGPWQAWGAQDR